MAQFVSNFAEPGDPEYAPPIKEVETRVRFSFKENTLLDVFKRLDIID